MTKAIREGSLKEEEGVLDGVVHPEVGLYLVIPTFNEMFAKISFAEVRIFLCLYFYENIITDVCLENKLEIIKYNNQRKIDGTIA